MPIILPILYKDDPKGLRAAERRLQKFQKDVGRTVAAGFAVAGLAAAKFGIDSVRAFAEAERAQLELQFAFEKFPQLADTNAEALNRLNTALMMKTRFDDDAIASAQGLLASFQLTGKQITELTPLLLDYAARTGRDLPSAAEALGKAMLGQGRALKEVGIDFKDAGSLAGNFDQIIAGLREQVGGFAEKDATTAAGKLEMLRNRFGEVQETVGQALMPALDSMLTWFEKDGIEAVEGFAGWLTSDGIPALEGFIDKISEMAENGTLVPSVVAGLSAMTLGMIAFNVATLANPVGLVILGLAALAAQFTVTMASLEDFKWSASNTGWGKALLLVFTGWFGIFASFAQNWEDMLKVAQFVFTGWINYVIRGINGILTPLQRLVDVINFLTGSTFSVRIPPVSFVYNDGRSAQTPAVSSQSGGNTRMAEGGLVVGPTRALIGEAGPEVVAPYDQFIETLGMSRGGGGSTYNVTVNAGMGTDGVSVGREIVKAIKRYERASGPVFAGA
jgi:hypothetical protein